MATETVTKSFEFDERLAILYTKGRIVGFGVGTHEKFDLFSEETKALIFHPSEDDDPTIGSSGAMPKKHELFRCSKLDAYFIEILDPDAFNAFFADSFVTGVEYYSSGILRFFGVFDGEIPPEEGSVVLGLTTVILVQMSAEVDIDLEDEENPDNILHGEDQGDGTYKVYIDPEHTNWYRFSTTSDVILKENSEVSIVIFPGLDLEGATDPELSDQLREALEDADPDGNKHIIRGLTVFASNLDPDMEGDQDLPNPYKTKAIIAIGVAQRIAV